MGLYKISLFTITLLMFFSCAQPPGETKAKISLAAVTGSANYGGGLLLYASNQAGTLEVIQPIPASDSLNLILPNGQWNFRVVGWSGGAQNKMFEGEPQCDYKQAVSLNGSDVILSMSPNFDKCVQGAQAAVAAGTLDSVNSLIDPDRNRFYRLAFGSCIDMTQRLQQENITVVPSDLGCGGGDYFLKSGAKSYRINLQGKRLDGSRSIGLVSDCRPLTEDYRNYTDINIPLGNALGDNQVGIQVFESADCSGTPSRQGQFLDGVINQVQSSNGAAIAIFDSNDATGSAAGNNVGYYGPNQKWMFIAVDAQGCTAGTLANQPFAAGSSASGQYLICNKEQWANIALGAGSCPVEVGVPAGTMDCEATAEYILGADIDFGGSNAIISNAFSGELSGNGYRLLNGNNPLFANIQSSPVANERTYIEGFTIENFNISNSSFYVGALAQQVTFSNDTDTQGVEISRLKLINSTIHSSLASGGGAVGGFIGWVDFSGTSQQNEYFSFRHNHSNSQVSSVSNATHASIMTNVFSTGGLIGRLQGPSGSNGGASLEFNTVGFSHDSTVDDPSDASHPYVRVEGYNEVGGLVGIIGDAEIRFGNIAKVELVGGQLLGGLIGASFNNTRINDSVAIAKFTEDVTYCTGDGICQDIGGIVGTKHNTYSLDANGMVSLLEIPATTYYVENVGGFAGSSAAGTIRVSHSKAMLNSVANGQYIGGFVGYANFLAGQTHFDSSVAMVNIDFQSDIPANASRGGAFGWSTNVNEKRLIVTGFGGGPAIINGNNSLGGFAGIMNGQTDEIYVEAMVTAEGATTPVDVGGFAGRVNTNGTPLNMNLKVDTDIYLNGAGGAACATLGCGILTGNQLNSAITVFTQSIANGTIEDSGMADRTANCGAGNCTGTEVTTTVYADTNGNCTALSGIPSPFIWNGTNCQPLFEQKWFESGYDATEFAYLGGSVIEPFIIDSVADWNAIGGDAFLVTKTFEVTQDIDFGGGSLTPIGTASVPFTGVLFGDGVIKNINWDIGTGGPQGLITAMDRGGKLGLRNNPLKFQDITLQSSSVSALGLVGEVADGGIGGSDAEIYVNVTNANYSCTTSGGCNVGGLVGRVTGGNTPGVRIEESLFQGQLSATGGTTDSVGGFVGDYAPTTSGFLNIENSAVYLSSLTSNGTTSYGAGFVGRHNLAAASLSIKESMVQAFNVSGPAGGYFGGLIGYTNGLANTTIKSNYVNYSSLTVTDIQVADLVGWDSWGAPSSEKNAVINAQGNGSGTTMPAPENAYASMQDLISNWSGNGRWETSPAGDYVHEWQIYGHDY